jgi:hypothetical protein
MHWKNRRTTRMVGDIQEDREAAGIDRRYNNHPMNTRRDSVNISNHGIE